MWKEIYNKSWKYYEGKWIEDGLTIVFIKSIKENKYHVHIKGKWCKSYKYNYIESDIEVAKLKGLIVASKEGWNIKKISV